MVLLDNHCWLWFTWASKTNVILDKPKMFVNSLQAEDIASQQASPRIEWGFLF